MPRVIFACSLLFSSGGYKDKAAQIKVIHNICHMSLTTSASKPLTVRKKMSKGIDAVVCTVYTRWTTDLSLVVW